MLLSADLQADTHALNISQAVLHGGCLFLLLFMSLLWESKAPQGELYSVNSIAVKGEEVAHNPMLCGLLCIGPHRPLAMICLLMHHL